MRRADADRRALEHHRATVALGALVRARRARVHLDRRAVDGAQRALPSASFAESYAAGAREMLLLDAANDDDGPRRERRLELVLPWGADSARLRPVAA